MTDYNPTISGTHRKKIAFINHWAEAIGGAELSLLELMIYLQHSFNCHILCSENGKLINRAINHAITCHIVPCHYSIRTVTRYSLIQHLLCSWHTNMQYILYIIRINRLLKKINPDILYANIPKSHICVMLLKLLGFKGQCILHFREIFPDRCFALTLYSSLFQRKNCSIIAISHAVYSHLPLKLQNHAIIIHNGIHIPETITTVPKNKHLFKMLYLGRIVPWKNCHILLDILQLFIKNNPSVGIHLSLVGDTLYGPPEYRKFIQKKVNESNLLHYCTLLDGVVDTDTYYVSHDIFCNASLNEPFGRVIVEAQSYGLPVIAFNSGAVPEILIHNYNGILVENYDINGFVEGLQYCIKHPYALKKMGMNGRRRVQKYFNSTIQLNKIQTFIFSCLK